MFHLFSFDRMRKRVAEGLHHLLVLQRNHIESRANYATHRSLYIDINFPGCESEARTTPVRTPCYSLLSFSFGLSSFSITLKILSSIGTTRIFHLRSKLTPSFFFRFDTPRMIIRSCIHNDYYRYIRIYASLEFAASFSYASIYEVYGKTNATVQSYYP